MGYRRLVRRGYSYLFDQQLFCGFSDSHFIISLYILSLSLSLYSVNYPEYYNNLYCPYASCLAAGGTKGSCGCVFYQKSCDLYANNPDYNTTEEIIQHCSATECCGALGEDDHLAKEGCFDGSPTPLPSMMPSGPTVSPRTASPNGEEEAVESPTDGVPVS